MKRISVPVSDAFFRACEASNRSMAAQARIILEQWARDPQLQHALLNAETARVQLANKEGK